MRTNRNQDWLPLRECPSQTILIPSLPPSTNHGYRLFSKALVDKQGNPVLDKKGNIKSIARMGKTSTHRDWKANTTKLISESFDVQQYEGRVIVTIAEYVNDFRTDTDGPVKFILDVMQKQYYKNDSQIDCLVPYRIRITTTVDPYLIVTIYDVGDFEITEFDLGGIMLRGVGWKKPKKDKYNNDSRRGKDGR